MAASLGITSSWSWSNFQSPESAPKVMSNLPSVALLSSRARFTTASVSGETFTADFPAAALIFETSLPFRQTVISCSSRSSSRNASSNARTAPSGSWVYAVIVTCVPIARCER